MSSPIDSTTSEALGILAARGRRSMLTFDEARGLITVGGVWVVIDRATGEIDEWPHLDYIERVMRMRPA